MQSFGIDISVYQKGIDITQAISEGVQFCIIKAGGADGSGGNKYKDSQFENHYANCSANRLPVGAYYFGKCTTTAGARAEAEHFITLIAGKQFPCKVWYDIEGSMCNLSKEMLSAIAKEFCSYVMARGYDCGVYASLSTFNKIDYDKSFSAMFPKWVAYWGKSKPLNISDSDMWQFGGETNLIKNNTVAGRVCDQDYAYFDFEHTAPELHKPIVALYSLYPGNIGPNVATLQQDLNYLFSADLIVDGIFGKKTKNALINAQVIFFPDDENEWDGKYGPKTYRKMKEAMDNAD